MIPRPWKPGFVPPALYVQVKRSKYSDPVARWEVSLFCNGARWGYLVPTWKQAIELAVSGRYRRVPS